MCFCHDDLNQLMVESGLRTKRNPL